MHGFRKDLDLTVIIGDWLTQISLGRYDLQLRFGKSGVLICIQGSVIVFENEENICEWNHSTNWSSLEFQRLLNQDILGVKVISSNQLNIHFPNSLTLAVCDDSEQFDTVQILFGDKSIPDEFI